MLEASNNLSNKQSISQKMNMRYLTVYLLILIYINFSTDNTLTYNMINEFDKQFGAYSM